MVYVLSGALTLVGGMFTVLMWFIKREHASITGGLAKLGESLHKLNNQITAVTLQLTELRADGARRISIEDHSRSSAYLHEKVNKLARRVDHMLGKMGLPPSGGEGEG
jgi:hypothetical protein